MRRYFRVTPYPDEEIGSLLTRMVRKVGLGSADFVAWHLGLDRMPLASVGNLVPSVAALIESTPRQVLLAHTLVPYGTAGLSPMESRRLTIALTSGRTLTSSARLGRIGRRWCATCLKEDLEKHGESYWRRAHLLPGVITCHAHGTALQESFTPAATQPIHRAVTYWLQGDLPHEIAGQPVAVSLPAGLRHAVCRESVRALCGRRSGMPPPSSPAGWRDMLPPEYLQFAGCRGNSLSRMPQTTASVLSIVIARRQEQIKMGDQLELFL